VRSGGILGERVAAKLKRSTFAATWFLACLAAPEDQGKTVATSEIAAMLGDLLDDGISAQCVAAAAAAARGHQVLESIH
jgi:hypothetical protein